jgi:hypothetical protein
MRKKQYLFICNFMLKQISLKLWYSHCAEGVFGMSLVSRLLFIFVIVVLLPSKILRQVIKKPEEDMNTVEC